MAVDVKTGLPLIDWQIGDTITVTCDDPAAVILSLTIRVNQEGTAPAAPELPPLLAYNPGTV